MKRLKTRLKKKKLIKRIAKVGESKTEIEETKTRVKRARKRKMRRAIIKRTKAKEKGVEKV